MARFFSKLQTGRIVDRETPNRLRTILAQLERADKDETSLDLPPTRSRST